ncbi:MAG: regulatory iron-sulfur-containing complex subunit RicT [Bacteroidota bacterium]
MGCSCGNTENGLPAGCKNNGSCGTSGCDKMPSFDWLANMTNLSGTPAYPFIQVRFKNGRKVFYKNDKGLSLNPGQSVVVDAQSGYDIGIVSLTGELARIQKTKKTKQKEEIRKTLRIPTEVDIEKWVAARKREKETMIRSRQIALALGLEMKIGDVEYQADGSKATFFYTAEERVDFRTLIVKLAEAFRIRVEMRQIGARQEAGMVGGIGSCGRELCCSTWLTDFRTVQTSSARYQQLAINPQKLAGQCGKLKCCLNYELDSYLEAVKDFPESNAKLETQKGLASLFKMDLFKRMIWMVYADDRTSSPIEISLKRFREIQRMNQKGKKPESLKDLSHIPKQLDFESHDIEKDSISRFDSKFKKGRKKKRRRPNKKRLAKK